ncbi:hypothetical protein PG999_001338 [Apiospora kogelbergensis]|uniref:Uncharacterized protein n=1 Tax=Apiospora kogelbergensis TaxID=1337665 RepID=A0AAW0RE01_9PEZI
MPRSQSSKTTQVKTISSRLQPLLDILSLTPRRLSILTFVPFRPQSSQWLEEVPETTKNPTKKPSAHKKKNKDDVPQDLAGVGSWCDDMPEQYQGSSADSSLDL